MKFSESPPSSPSDSSSEGSPPPPELPSALRGISIQGNSKALLNNLLGKKGNEEEKEEKGKEDSQAAFLKEWSSKCLSISFSSKVSAEEQQSENEGEEGDEEDEEGEEDRVRKAPKERLENGTPSSSSSNSASNSRDAFSAKDKPPATNSSISIKPLTARSISLSVVKAPSNNDNSESSPRLASHSKTENKGEGNLASNSIEKEPEETKNIEEGNSSFEEDIPLHERLQQSKQISQNSTSKRRPEEEKFTCSFCSETFTEHSKLLNHIPNCRKLGIIVSLSNKKRPYSTPVARKRTLNLSLYKETLKCVICKVSFSNKDLFENHHINHIKTRKLLLLVPKYTSNNQPSLSLETTEDSDSRDSGSGSNSNSSLQRTSEDKSLKLKFKISSELGKGKKKTKVQIVNSEMSKNNTGEAAQEEGSQLVEGSEGTNQSVNSLPGNIAEPSDQANVTPASNNNLEGATSFNNYNNQQLNFGADTAADRPPSTYQPQFESFPGDWFNEYESGSRIAAAMTGSSSEGADPNDRSGYDNSSNSNDTPFGSEDARNNRTSPFTNNTSSSDASKELPSHSSNDRDGLFSQAVLGGEPNQGNDDARQGSFEQLCLNDSFGQNQQEGGIAQPNIDPNYQGFNQPVQGSGNDLLSELAYLNNNGQQIDPSARVSPMEGENRPFSSHSSNSGTPTSSGHPTPPPTDTSFRALATSPTSPLTTSGPTPPMQPGVSPPIQNSSSPLQQMVQMGSQPQDTISAPRLTIANNLMPTTTNSGIGPIPSSYGQQWSPGSNSPQNFASSYMQNSSMTSPMGTALGNGIRPQVHNNLPMGYRPSPPPRIRGRPPLMGHVGRPPMMRGPGRPPGSSAIPPLMTGPGGTRGGMMPSLQRLPQYNTGPRQPLISGQKRAANTTPQSPSKTLRREDINVPSRQKDNECQIIAVANRTGDGMPVIANVQGGGSRDDRTSRNSPATTSESTIHLSDSITLSVRSNSGAREAARSEKGGDAGVVANLLASRGITVTPAAGEKEGGGNGGREERRLPTASDLNLSSAISVHPPTSRDRDGFAVPHPPSAKSSSSGSSSSSSSSINSQVDRPPRPPTVDLTQDIPTGGSQATRLQCHQCDRTFPTQALLADHTKIHQQQTQSRMPFKCHLCTAGFSTQKGQQNHYQQFHQLHLSAGDIAIPLVDLRNPVNVQRMARLGIRSFLPLNNLQNRGAGGVVGIPILTLENLHNGQMNIQQWGVSDVLTLGPPRTINAPR